MTTTVVEKTYTSPSENIVYDGNRFSHYYSIQNVLYAILTFIEVVILTRILFIFLGANDTGIAKFVYDLSSPFVAPFFGVFKTQALPFNGYRLEWESVIAIICYAIVFWAISTILRIVMGNREY